MVSYSGDGSLPVEEMLHTEAAEQVNGGGQACVYFCCQGNAIISKRHTITLFLMYLVTWQFWSPSVMLRIQKSFFTLWIFSETLNNRERPANLLLHKRSALAPDQRCYKRVVSHVCAAASVAGPAEAAVLEHMRWATSSHTSHVPA